MPDPKRPMSWSQISSFEWNRDQWWRKYIGGEIPETTPELEFGSYVDKKIQDDPTYLPHVIRYSVLQHEMRCEFNSVPLIGIADAYEPPEAKKVKDQTILIGGMLSDFKTGRRPWDQKRADETGQLTMYALMLYLTAGIKPETITFSIQWLPTHIKDGKVEFIEPDHTKLKPVTFHTKRTMRDALKFGQKIMDTYAEMHEYCRHRPTLDTHSYDDFYAN